MIFLQKNFYKLKIDIGVYKLKIDIGLTLLYNKHNTRCNVKYILVIIKEREVILVKNKKTFGILSLILAIISLIPIIFVPDSLNGAQIFTTVALILAIMAVVFGFIGKKDSKGMSIAAIIIGIISTIVMILALFGFLMYSKVTDCIDNGNGTSTCMFGGQEMEVPTSYLEESQMTDKE